MNLVTFSGYWRNYSRLLSHQDGIKIEISMTPPPPTTRGWDNIAEQRVRVHTTSSKGDKTMGIDFMPESAVTLMRGYLGEELTTRICEFDYLSEMMRIFNTQDVDVLRDYLRRLPSNGGIKWEEILAVEPTRFDGTAAYIGSEYGISEKDYSTPAAFYKSVCDKLEGRRDAVSAMTYMVGLLIKAS